MIHYDKCPICKSDKISYSLTAVDHTVSKERFEIWYCDSCTGMFTQNVPEKDAIGKYYQSADYISHSDTQAGLINKMYHQVRNITLKQKRKLVERNSGLLQGKLLDIGCGTGSFLNEMKQNGWSVSGLEPDAGARETALRKFGITTRPSHEIFDLPSNEFDAVTMWHVLEHVHELNEYIQKIKEILKPNGKAFIAVPNYTSLDALHYKEFWAAYDVPRHLYHFSPKSMNTLLTNHGLKLIAMKPMVFDSWYVSMLSEKYKSGGSNNYFNAFTEGLTSNLNAALSPTKFSSIIYVVAKI